jgi:hypothetical protein
MAYNGDMNGEGSDSGGPIINTPPQGDIIYSWNDSVHKFTNPPRYYKANDPYYYEVDNIPLKQIHENCLWLKDQISGGGGGGGTGGFSASGITKRDIEDLKPSVNGTDRIVTVNTGNFIGRVNDPTLTSHDGWPEEGGDDQIDFSRTKILRQKGFKISVAQWFQLVDSQVSYNSGDLDLFGLKSNGLLSTYTFNGDASFNNGGLGSPLTPLTSSAWKNIVSGDSTLTGSLDLDMAFRRRWSGVFRTSVVNVTQPLSIQVPSFSTSDWVDHMSTLDPQVRIDLLCIYTVPVDGNGSARVLPGLDGPKTINRPELVLVKGAGGILAAKGDPPAPDIITPDPVNDLTLAGYTLTDDTDPGYYDTTGGVDGDASLAIKSSMTNQLSPGVDPYANVNDQIPRGSFPSPDDLLNLAPIIAENLSTESIQLVGQTVLPLAYIVVRKNAPAIVDTDIIDIRPFMRTAELAYNERAGVGAANPPLSLANPAVGKGEMYDAMGGLRDYIKQYIEDLDLGGGGGGGDPVQSGFLHPQCDLGIDNNLNTQSTVGAWTDMRLMKPVTYNSRDVATFDTAMSQVNGGNVFSFGLWPDANSFDPDMADGPEEFASVKVVRGKYRFTVLNQHFQSGSDPAQFKYAVRIKKGTTGVVNRIYPRQLNVAAGVPNLSDAWDVRDGFGINAETGINASFLAWLDDGDEIFFSNYNSGGSPQGTCRIQGSWSIERVPDFMIY